MNKYTSGPWVVKDVPQRGLEIHWCEYEPSPICHMRWHDGMRQQVTERVAADARLIAAAPDLLEACKLIVGVKHAMMCVQIHDEQSLQEVLEKHGAENIQLLAKKAQDMAEAAILKAETP